MNKWIIIIIIIMIAIGAGVWWKQSNAPVIPVPDDNTAVIEQDLLTIDLGDVEKDMEMIDKDVNQL